MATSTIARNGSIGSAKRSSLAKDPALTRCSVLFVLRSTMGDRYRVRVADDGGVVGLWRR